MLLKITEFESKNISLSVQPNVCRMKCEHTKLKSVNSQATFYVKSPFSRSIKSATPRILCTRPIF